MATSTTEPPDVRSGRAPGPLGHWLLGNLEEFRADRLAFYEQCRDEFGGVAAFRLGHRRVLTVTDPAAIEEVLLTRNRDFRKHYMLELLRPLLGNGLLMNEGEDWLRQRRLVQPDFRPDRIAGYGEVFVRHADRILETWHAGETSDVYADMQNLAMGIAAETLLGVDIDDGIFEEVNAANEVLTADFAWRFEQLLTLPMWVPTPRNRNYRSAVRRLERVVFEIIDRKRADPGEDSTDDLLSRLLRARAEEDGRGMTDRQLRDEVMTLFLAGHETTANALSWSLYLLAGHPKVAQRIRDEVDTLVGNRRLTSADVPDLQYVRRVMRESMRLYPPAYAFGRAAIRETSIGGYAVSRGTTIILPQWAVHRDPRIYERPADFDPDRWTPEFEAALPKFAYLPFGGGPRLCIGHTFAELEVVLVLATLARHVSMTIDDSHPIELWPSITLRPRYGIRARIDRR